jgi:hypothetical protein
MMKTVRMSLLTLVWGMQLSAQSGCAVPGENISKKGVVTVQRVPSTKVDILWADVYKIEESLVVRGVVRRRNYSSQPLQVHVDVAVLSADSKILTEAIGRDVWVPRRLAGKGFNYDQFEVRLPVAPPEGGTVKLVCHAGSRDVHLATGITRN